MKTLKLIILSLLVSFISFQTNAQTKTKKNRGKKAEIFAYKMGFFKENLNLSERESNDFEKLYTTYAENNRKIKTAYRKEVFGRIKKKEIATLSEREQMDIIEKKQRLDEEKFNLKKQFTKDLLQILPAEKVLKYFQLERQFNKKMIKKLRSRTTK